MRARVLVRTASILLAAHAAACSCDSPPSADTGVGRVDTGVRPPMDTGPRVDSGPGCVYALPIDILFVVDNSNSMAEEQINLTANFSDLLEILTNPPDEDRNGMPDFPAAEDVRVGIVSTDMGVGSYTVPSCDMAGDRGVLVTEVRNDDPMCAGISLPATEPWLSYTVGDDTAELGRRFSCLARLGTDGCGLEQQLESMYGALITQAAPGMPNAGFVRDDSLLAVVFVTDEDDCSASDTAIFDPSRVGDLGPYGLRCAQNPTMLHPIDRYEDALDSLRLDRLNPIVIGAITGVPTMIDPLTQDYDALLMDPRMQYMEDPGNPGQLIPACDRPGSGFAIPARRIVELSRRFAARGDGLASSICEDDLSPAMRALGTLIGRRLCPPLE